MPTKHPSHDKMTSPGGNESSTTASYPSIIELNVGGVFYTTSLKTLTRCVEILKVIQTVSFHIKVC